MVKAMVRGTVVRSLAGRDAGGWFALLEADGKSALLADGKGRPLERPKRKNLRHLAFTRRKLEETALHSNRALRAALRSFCEHCDEGGK